MLDLPTVTNTAPEDVLIYGVNETYRITYSDVGADVWVKKTRNKTWKLWRENITYKRAKYLRTALDPRNSP